jgi:hypothetical protein
MSATYDHMWPLQTLCSLSSDSGIGQCEKGNNFVLLRNTDINTYIIHAQGPTTTKKYFNEQQFADIAL